MIKVILPKDVFDQIMIYFDGCPHGQVKHIESAIAKTMKLQDGNKEITSQQFEEKEKKKESKNKKNREKAGRKRLKDRRRK